MKLEEKITHVIIACSTAHFWLNELKHTGTLVQASKNLLNRTISMLEPYNKQYEELDKHEENALTGCHDVYLDFISTMSSVKIYEAGEITEIIKAYRKDKKSMLGIAKKVNK